MASHLIEIFKDEKLVEKIKIDNKHIETAHNKT